MKKITSAIVVAILTLGAPTPSYSHGGGLDWQGGHNCRVGACAGTYHCHQARAGVCAPIKKNNVKPSKKSAIKG